MPQTLQFDDIQRFVVRPYGFPFTRYLFLQFKSAAQGRQWLGKIVDTVTPASYRTGNDKPKPCQNVAFTYEGLATLGLEGKSLATFSEEFIDGMHARARVIGDTVSPSKPNEWELGNPSKADQQIHALLMLFASSTQELNEFSQQHAEIRNSVGSIEVVHSVDGMRRFNRTEHFDFLDGASQPLIEGVDDEKYTQGSPNKLLKAGEFVLGYRNEYDTFPPSPTVSADTRAVLLPQTEKDPTLCDFGKNGSYIVCRKLAQDVAAFRQFLSENAPEPATPNPKGKHNAEVEWLAAKLVGRWRDGTPVTVSPDKSTNIKGDERNNFTFNKDVDGLRCPIGAHIRRTNPRDTFGLTDTHGDESFKTVNRHRILRRGMPYGPALDGMKDDGKERGLMFLCVNADIAAQYEFVQKWMNDPSFNGLYQDQDIFSHAHEGKSYVTIPEYPVRQRVPLLKNYVTVKGGAYFFMPGINALRYLAAL